MGRDHGLDDTGKRQTFDNGAMREPVRAGKGDMYSLPFHAMLRYCVHLERGAQKYAQRNYIKGLPTSRFFDSALRHLFQYGAGDDSEDHLAAAMFNIGGLMEMEAQHPEMCNMEERANKKTYNYYGGKQDDEGSK